MNDTDAVYKRALQAGGTSITEPADQWDASERADTGDQRARVRDVTTRTLGVSRRDLRSGSLGGLRPFGRWERSGAVINWTAWATRREFGHQIEEALVLNGKVC